MEPPPENAAIGLWSILVDFSTIIGAVMAGLAVVVALGVGTSFYQSRRLLALRWRYLWPTFHVWFALHSLGVAEPDRVRFKEVTLGLLAQRLDSPNDRVVDELNWIGDLLGATGPEREHGHSVEVTYPVGFVGELRNSHQELLDGLSEGYIAYAASVRRKWILRSAAGPLVAAEHELALAAAEVLASFARVDPAPRHKDPGHLASQWLNVGHVGPRDPQDRVRLLVWPDVQLPRATLHFASIAVSYVPYRLVVPGTPGSDRRPPHLVPREVPWLPMDQRREDRRHELGEVDREFDGIMTRLHGPGWRREVDPFSGRQRLHLCVSETSFFAFRATSWREYGAEKRGEFQYAARLLSVNLILLDDEDRAVLVRRNRAMSHGGTFAGAASGACEVVPREGMPGDLDAAGVPDPMKTIVREAHEEIGYDISQPDWKLSALGLIQVETSRDLGTYVLTATARLPWSATDFRVRRGSTDDIEGSWELGADSMIIDLTAMLESRETLEKFVRWLRSDPEILAHAVGGLLLLLTVRLEMDAKRHPDGLYGASIADLADLVREGVVDQSPRPRQIQLQPLWDSGSSV